jgi:hypothetical protein
MMTQTLLERAASGSFVLLVARIDFLNQALELRNPCLVLLLFVRQQFSI